MLNKDILLQNGICCFLFDHQKKKKTYLIKQKVLRFFIYFFSNLYCFGWLFHKIFMLSEINKPKSSIYLSFNKIILMFLVVCRASFSKHFPKN